MVDNLVKNVVTEVLNDYTNPIINDITQRIEFFTQSKLKEIEESCHCTQHLKTIERLHVRIGNLESLCHQQTCQMTEACNEIDALKKGTTDILRRNSLNGVEMEKAMNDISNGTFDDDFSFTNIFDSPISSPGPLSPLAGRKRKLEKQVKEKTDDPTPRKKGKRYFNWEERMATLLDLDSFEWDGDIITISRRDVESLFPIGKSLFQFTRCYGKKGDKSRFDVKVKKSTNQVRLHHRCLNKESILSLYGKHEFGSF